MVDTPMMKIVDKEDGTKQAQPQKIFDARVHIATRLIMAAMGSVTHTDNVDEDFVEYCFDIAERIDKNARQRGWVG